MFVFEPKDAATEKKNAIQSNADKPYICTCAHSIWQNQIQDWVVDQTRTTCLSCFPLNQDPQPQRLFLKHLTSFTIHAKLGRDACARNFGAVHLRSDARTIYADLCESALEREQQRGYHSVVKVSATEHTAHPKKAQLAERPLRVRKGTSLWLNILNN